MTAPKVLSMSLSVAALALTMSLGTGPAAAYDDEGSTARAARTWTGSAKRSGEASYNSSESSGERRTTSRRRTSDNDNGTASEGRSRRYDEGGLDPDEAVRIRRAHRESEGHVTLRRDDDGYDYGMRSYHTPGHMPGYERRRHWWSSWW
jgi:hypothetical protein